MQTKCYSFPVFLLLFLSLIPITKASPDFSAYSQASLDLCSCSNYTNQIYVTNNEAVKTTVSIKTFNSASGFVKLPLKSFDLNPRETRTVMEKISVPCEFIGNYALDTIIKYGFAANKISQKVNIQDCYAIGVEIEKNHDELCYEQKNYSIKIKNKGSIAQTINLSLKGKNAELDKGTIILKPDQETTAILTVNSSNATERMYSVKAKTRYSESTATLNVKSISNKNCYMLAFLVPDIKTDYSQKTARIRFENNGIKEGNYALSLEPDWLFIDEINFKLAPRQIKEIALVASPLGISQGVYEGKITATEVGSGEMYEKTFTLTIKEKDQTWNKIKESTIVFWAFINDYWFRLLLGSISAFASCFLIKKAARKIKKAIKKARLRRKRGEIEVISVNHKEEKTIRNFEKDKQKSEKRMIIKKIFLTISVILVVGAIYFVFYYFKI